MESGGAQLVQTAGIMVVEIVPSNYTLYANAAE